MPGGRAPSQPTSALPDDEPKLSIRFQGGTAEEYVRAIKEAASFPVNVILSPAARTVQLASIELQDVNTITAVKAMQAASNGSEGRWDIDVLGGGRSQGGDAFGVDYFSREMQEKVNAQDRQMLAGLPGGAGPNPSSGVVVCSVRELLGGAGSMQAGDRVSPDALLSAVEAALQMTMGEQGPPPEVKFHPQTALLIVRGTEMQQATVKNVLDQMRKDADARKSEQDAKKQEAMRRIGLNAELREAGTRRRAAEERVSAAEAKLERLRAARESGGVSEQEMDAAGAEARKTREELSLAVLQEERVNQLAKLTLDRGDSWVSLIINTKALSPAEFARFDSTLQTIIFSGQDHFGGHFPAADRSNIRVWTDDEMATRLDGLAKEFGCDSYRDFPSDPPATDGSGAPGTPAK
jgi:hypothetical protein